MSERTPIQQVIPQVKLRYRKKGTKEVLEEMLHPVDSKPQRDYLHNTCDYHVYEGTFVPTK